MRVKHLSVERGRQLGIENYPSFHASGNITGMKNKFYGKNALLVRCGSWIYNVDSRIYYEAY